MTSIAAKKREGKDGTKAKLLKAALDVFSKQGFDAATTRIIAKKAGVNESLIHRYFESKLGLFLALKQQFREKFIRSFLADVEATDLEAELVRFVKSRLQSSHRDKKFFRLAISRAIVDPTSREDIQSYASLRPPELLARFERFRQKGQIRKDVDLDEVISILHAISFSFVMLMDCLECLEMAEAEKLIQTAARVLADGLKP